MKRHAMDIYVIFCLTVLLAYTVAALVIFCQTGGAETATLTTCVFGSFGGEILACCLIKIFKLKREREPTVSPEDGIDIIDLDEEVKG
ncbi:hypothetical protein [Lachnoclostridium sp. Marseille-P6806]|uniref:hypothetical protein n=1 Tax=Lachnoclostridium sp. Marseille-P6806 TaxID=2364793 RepID=UPI00102FE9F6|nr:hypothetical protein [Lachnoclostridium sp. Marseille-P6806]